MSNLKQRYSRNSHGRAIMPLRKKLIALPGQPARQSFADFLHAEVHAAQDRCIAQVYQQVTGEELTADNVADVRMLRQEGLMSGYLLQIRDTVVGAVLLNPDGDKFNVTFDPEITSFEGLS